MNITKFYNLIWNEKKVILFIFFVSVSLLQVIAFFVKDLYTSSAQVMLVNADNEAGDLLSNFGSAASLTGIDLPSSPTSSSDYILAILQSRDFVSLLNAKLELDKHLIAVKGFDLSRNKFQFKKNIYNEFEKKWTRKATLLTSSQPSISEIHKEFTKRLQIYKNKGNFIEIHFTHYSPFFAAQVINEMLLTLNSFDRDRELTRVNRAISFLQSKFDSSTEMRLKETLSKLIQKELETLVLINKNEDYLITFLDKPYLPDKKSFPNRILFFVSSILAGIALSFLYMVSKYIFLLKDHS